MPLAPIAPMAPLGPIGPAPMAPLGPAVPYDVAANFVQPWRDQRMQAMQARVQARVDRAQAQIQARRNREAELLARRAANGRRGRRN